MAAMAGGGSATAATAALNASAAAAQVAAITSGKFVEPTYLVKPYEEQKFSSAAARAISEEVCASVLNGKVWSGDGEEVVWTVQITESVKEKVKALNFPRYKIIVQAMVGQQKHQGVRVVSRCLWDTNTDSCSSYTYSSDTLWATVMVFGLYIE